MLSANPTTMKASGTGHKGGLVPDPGASSGTTKFLCEDGTFAVPAGGGGGGGGSVLVAKTVLTNAQIKALPSTPIQLVTAPGSGKIIAPHDAWLSWDLSAAPYDSDTTDQGSISLGWNNAPWGSLMNTSDGGNILDRFLTAVIPIGVTNIVSALPIFSSEYFGIVARAIFSRSDVENQPLTIFGANLGGDFTGGDPANTLTVNVVYVVLDL